MPYAAVRIGQKWFYKKRMSTLERLGAFMFLTCTLRMAWGLWSM